MGTERDGWTVEDAARILDPVMSAIEVRALIIAARIQPIGRRRHRGAGRPLRLYDPADLLQAHAGVAPMLVISEFPCKNQR